MTRRVSAFADTLDQSTPASDLARVTLGSTQHLTHKSFAHGITHDALVLQTWASK